MKNRHRRRQRCCRLDDELQPLEDEHRRAADFLLCDGEDVVDVLLDEIQQRLADVRDEAVGHGALRPLVVRARLLAVLLEGGLVDGARLEGKLGVGSEGRLGADDERLGAAQLAHRNGSAGKEAASADAQNDDIRRDEGRCWLLNKRRFIACC